LFKKIILGGGFKTYRDNLLMFHAIMPIFIVCLPWTRFIA